MGWLFTNTKSVRASAGLLLLRVVVGAAFVLHGYGKIQHPTSWMPGGQFPGFLQAAAAVAEFGGGIALVLGLLTPLAALGIAATMAVAIFTYHVPQQHVFVALKPGEPSFELPAAYLASAIALLLVGPGQFSVDGCLACTFGGCATKGSTTNKKEPVAAA